MSTLSNFGFAVCCGADPVLRAESGLNARCPICRKRVGVYGGLDFLRHHWNATFNGTCPETNNREQMDVVQFPSLVGLPSGWRTADLTIEAVGYGHKQEMARIEGALFYSARDLKGLLIAGGEYECGIDTDRYIDDLVLAVSPINWLTLKWPTRKRFPYSCAYATRTYWTNGDWNLILHLQAWAQRDVRQLREWLDTVKEQR